MDVAPVGVKALMVDVDGVVVVHPHGRRWDCNIEADFGIASADLQRAFFHPHFRDVLLRRADLHERLAVALAEIAPHVAPEELSAYWFARDSRVDHELLKDLRCVRAGGIRVHLATSQEHRRARYLWSVLKLCDRFDAMHYSAALGCEKPDAAFFRAIEARTGFEPAELLLIDDLVSNVKAARGCGWSAEVWDGSERLADLLRRAGVTV